MNERNPYDGYDMLDPWDDEDSTGGFDFVEDEYDSMEEGVGDGFSYATSPVDMTAAQAKGSTEAFPATQVRPAFGQVVTHDGNTAAQPVTQNKVLRRRRKRGRGGEQSRGQVSRVPAPAQEQARAPRRPRRRRKHHFGCLFTLLLVCTVVVGAYWVLAHPIDQKLAFSPAEEETLKGNMSWSFPGMPYYVLALGSDAREGDTYSRTHTMMLVRVDLLGGKITLVSIPRDTKVQIEGYGTSKINAAYAYGGAGGAVRAVSDLTGVGINHVAVVHFEELEGLIDLLGGVTVNVPVDVYDPDHSGLVLSAGMQTMDGKTALLWARTRYGFVDGDHQRQEDQRILLSAIMNRMLSLSPREMPQVLDQVGGLVGTDMRCYNLVPLLVRFKLMSPTVYSCALPTEGELIDGVWFEIMDEEGMRQIMQVVNAGGDPSTVA